MDIVKNNYKQLIPEFLNELPKATCVGIDLEMSGIKNDESTSENDTPMEHYMKTIVAASRYRIIQIGMALFIPIESSSSNEQRYETKVYNFYVFPHSYKEKINQDIRLDTSTVDFLNKIGTVDFNKWITEGIPYSNEHCEQKLKSIVYNNWLYNTISDLKAHKEEPSVIHEQSILDRITPLIAEFCVWYNDNQTVNDFKLHENRGFIQKYFLEQVYKLNPLLFDNILITHVKRKDDVAGYIIFNKISPENLKIHIATRKAEIDQEYNDALGFSYFWPQIKKIIATNNIPVVLHNSFLDLLFIYSHFEKNLTRDMLEYKRHVHENVFPLIYDTKAIAAEFKLEKYALSELWTALGKSDFVKTAVTFENKFVCGDEAFSYHNAAFDAYITGCAFLTMKHNTVGVEKYLNRVKLFGSGNFQFDLNNPTMDHIISDTVYALYPKVKPSSSNNEVVNNNKDKNGKPIRKPNNKKEDDKNDEKRKLFELISEMNKDGTLGDYRISEHKPMGVIEMSRVLILRCEKPLYEGMTKALRNDYDIYDMRTYYTLILEAFDSKVYKHKDVNKIYNK